MDQEKIKQLVIDTIRRYESTPLVTVNISNRHIHLSEEDVDILFGNGHRLTPIKDLMQPGQFACQETLTIKGPKESQAGVRVLGPVRKESQVEISLTDGFRLGVAAPVSESGKLSGAAPITITNPLTGASIERRCAIAALRHIHLSPDYAKKFGFTDKEMVSVKFSSAGCTGEQQPQVATRPRSITFHDVLLRVSENFVPEMHLDTDEANAGCIVNGDLGLILKN